MMRSTGLRERKKEQTRRSVQKTAMALFAQHGYAETSVEQIADAANISAATFYRYFLDKEDVVFSLDYSPFLERVVSERPPNESFAITIRAIFRELAGWFEADKDLFITRRHLIKDVPALKARRGVLRHDVLDTLAELISPRFGLSPTDYQLRLSLAVILAAQTETVSFWAESKGRQSLADLLEQTFYKIRPILKIESKRTI